MINEVVVAMLAVIAVLNAWVTWRALRDALSTGGQRAAQIALIWLLPVMGALLVLRLQRRQLEQGSGKYRPVPDAGDDLAYSRQSFKQLDRALDEQPGGSAGDATGD
jgi:hypothetical protein